MKQAVKSLLCILLIMSLVSCSGGTGKDADSMGKETVPAEPDTSAAETQIPETEPPFPASLPAELDFEGRTFTAFVPGAEFRRFHAGDEEISGEVVNDATIARNQAVEARLNITLDQQMQNDIAPYQYKTKVTPLILAGDDTYDLYLGFQYQLVTMLDQGGFVNQNELEYLDFSQSWWWNGYMDELTLNPEKRYFSIGDYSMQAVSYTFALFYNKDLYGSNYGDGEGLYDVVMNGDWTLDAMTELVESVYADLNSNGEVDLEDQLGFVNYQTAASVDPVVYSTDISFVNRLDDGRLELNMIQDDAVTLAEKLNKLFWQPGSYHAINSNEALANQFSAGKTLFCGGSLLFSAESYRDMESEFGIIPFPKLDEEQKEYRSLVHDAAMLTAVNGSSKNLDIAGAVMEALCAETSRTVLPAYYETALKIKYTRDNKSAQMIDLIHDNMRTNFVFAYNYSLGNIGTIYRSLVTGKSTNYVSVANKTMKASQTKLDELYDFFMKNTDQ